MVGVGPDQLDRDAHPAARFAHAAFEHIAHAQFLADLLDVDGLAFVGEGRVAGDHREGAPAGEHRDDVLGDAVGEELLLGIAAEICERQHGDGTPIVEIRRARREHGGGDKLFRQLGHLAAHPVDPDGSCYVLEALGPEILEIEIDFAGDLLVDDIRYIDTAGLGQRLDPRRDVDAVAEDVAFLGDDVAEIDPDPHRDALFLGQRPVRLRDRIAQSGGTARRLDDVVEISEDYLGGLFEDVSAEFADLRFDDPGQKPPQLGKVLLLVAGEQAAVAGYQYSRKPARDTLCPFVEHGSRAPLTKMQQNSPLLREYSVN